MELGVPECGANVNGKEKMIDKTGECRRRFPDAPRGTTHSAHPKPFVLTNLFYSGNRKTLGQCAAAGGN
jgi:hypothetical protein